MKFLNYLKKLLIYIIGLIIISVGINTTKMSGLGIAPVSSTPGVLAKKFPAFSLGSMVIIIYCLLVIAQLVVLRKDFKAKNILGVPVAIIFGWLVDFFGIAKFKLTVGGLPIGINKEFTGLLYLFPKPANTVMRFVYLFAGILLLGIGVYIYLRPKLTPMPAEGLAAAISQKTGKAFGSCKSIVDVSLIVIASVLQFVFFGISSFLIDRGVVGIGTILAAFLVGQTVKLISKIFSK